LPGEILVQEGQTVRAEDVVAKAQRPGRLSIVHATSRLGLDPADLDKALRVRPGDMIQQGDLLAEVHGLWGLFRGHCLSPVSGQVEYASNTTGHLGIRMAPVPVQIQAFIDGVVLQRLGNEGVVLQGHGALIQGIYGWGGERRGVLCMADSLDSIAGLKDQERVLFYPRSLTDAEIPEIQNLSHLAAILVAGVPNSILKRLCDPNQWPDPRQVPTLILTDGFGQMEMDRRVVRILEKLQGRVASVDGTTRIRAGVVRPEIFVSLSPSEPSASEAHSHVPGSLQVDSRVRVLTYPNFAAHATVLQLPEEPCLIESGSLVRVAHVRLDTGEVRTVPRANLEVIVD